MRIFALIIIASLYTPCNSFAKEWTGDAHLVLWQGYNAVNMRLPERFPDRPSCVTAVQDVLDFQIEKAKSQGHWVISAQGLCKPVKSQ